jgi:ABC-type dipeptide/oligopeptide/nickel transport system permease subunit
MRRPVPSSGWWVRAVLASDSALRFRRNRSAVAGATIVSAVVIVALFAQVLAPHSVEDTDLLAVFSPPSTAHPLGTDNLGRDTLSRLVVGAQVSLTIALSVLAITLTVGVTLGMVAGYRGGLADTVVMRVVDVIFAFPELIFAILLATVLGTGTRTVIAALAVVWWPGIARLTRSLVLSLRTAPFIDAAVTSGTPPRTILWRHVLPNIVAPVITRASIGVGFLITAEATLSFLGIGVQEPTPSWGSMIRDGLGALRTDPHLALFPSLALGLTIIGFNLLGDGLRDLLDPRVRER